MPTYPVAQFPVAVDCVIFGFFGTELKVLLVQRRFEPGQGTWSLMGGFVNDGEGVEATAGRVLRELTGLEDVALDQVRTFGAVERDPGARVISIVYSAFIKVDANHVARTEHHRAVWSRVDELPALIFDHDAMIASALERLREIALSRPTGRELLPARFTMRELQSFYEALFSMRLDASNFRKKILATGILQQLPEKDRSASRRGAHYYAFDKAQYRNPKKFNLSFYLTKE